MVRFCTDDSSLYVMASYIFSHVVKLARATAVEMHISVGYRYRVLQKLVSCICRIGKKNEKIVGQKKSPFSFLIFEFFSFLFFIYLFLIFFANWGPNLRRTRYFNKNGTRTHLSISDPSLRVVL